MKYLLIFFVILSFIGPVAENTESTSSIIRNSIFNYITSLDRTVSYLSDNFEIFRNLKELPYKVASDKIMKDRKFEKHFILSGENLDSIIQLYNSDIDNIDSFRKIILDKNPDIVSSDYSIKSGNYILVPSEK